MVAAGDESAKSRPVVTETSPGHEDALEGERHEDKSLPGEDGAHAMAPKIRGVETQSRCGGGQMSDEQG